MQRTKHISVVLGSGGARGLAHIGVLKALEEHRMPITMLVGTSIGALIGGLYASGISVSEIEALALRTDKITMAKILTPKFFSAGLVDNKSVLDYIRALVGSKTIEQLNMPFAAVATDYVTGREVVLRNGPLVDAIMASIAIPTIFQPVFLHDRFLLDGGLSNPLPVSVAREMNAERILAVNVSPDPEKLTKRITTRRTEEIRNMLKKVSLLVEEKLSGHARSGQPPFQTEQSVAPDGHGYPTLARVILQSMTIATNNLVVQQLQSARPDVLLSPNIEEYDTLDFLKGREVIQRGYDATINEIPLIRSRLLR